MSRVLLVLLGTSLCGGLLLGTASASERGPGRGCGPDAAPYYTESFTHGAGKEWSPDDVSVSVDGHHRAASFSNDAAPHEPGYEQTYPNRYASRAAHPGLTGATSTGTLGYPDVSAYGGVGDATYSVTATLPHRASTLTLRVTSRNVVDPDVDPIGVDESTGLDNVSVELLGRGCRPHR